MNALDNYYLSLPEPTQSCLLALRDLILAQSEHLTPSWKWSTPFFDYKGRYLFYLSIDQKQKLPYIGITNGNKIDHPALIQGKRKQIKHLLIDPSQDLPVKQIQEIAQLAMAQRDQVPD
jgi:hypothetical protein